MGKLSLGVAAHTVKPIDGFSGYGFTVTIVVCVDTIVPEDPPARSVTVIGT